MKIFQRLFYIFIFCILTTASSFAQNVTCRQIGEGTNSHPYLPFAIRAKHSYTQQLYSTAELMIEDIKAGDNITAIAFNYFLETPTKRPIKIFLGNTTQSMLTANNWISTSLLEEVFSSDCQEFSKGDENWTKITLNTSFTYTGGNLVVAVLMNTEENTDIENCFTNNTSSENRFHIHNAPTLGSALHGRVNTNNAPIITFDENGLPKSGTNLKGNSIQLRNNIKFCKIGDACPKVSKIKAINSSESSITLNWLNGSDESSWTIEYGAVDFIQGTGTSILANSNPFTIENLEHSTGYDVYIRANCSDDDKSLWAKGPNNISTECGTVNSQNFIENFNNNSQNLNCWTIIDADDTPSLNNNGMWSFTDDKAQYKASSDLNANDWLISPRIDIKEGMKLTFDYKTSLNKTEKFSIHLITADNPNQYANESTTKLLAQTQTVSNINYITIPPISLDEYKNQKAYIAIKCESDAAQGILDIDKFRVYIPSSEKNITKISISEQSETEIINYEDHELTVTVSKLSDLTNLTATITVSEYATIDQGTGSINDFSSSKTYIVTAEDGSTQPWTVTVTKAADLSSKKDIVNFSFPDMIGSADINTENQTVTANANWNIDLSKITPIIQTSYLSTIDPASGIETNFSNEVVYKVRAQDETEVNWKVTIIPSGAPEGVRCENPVILDLSTLTTNPHSILGETTVNFGNIYSNTSLDYNDNGNDKVYKLSVSENSLYSISLITETNYVAMGLFKGCPSDDILLESTFTNFVGGTLYLNDILLQAGTEYFLMVDKGYSPEYISSYDLIFTKNETPTCTSPIDLELTEVLQTEAKFTWTSALTETQWELKYGPDYFDPAITEESLGTLVTENISSPYTLTGLEPDQKYSIYIRSKCSNDSYGEWSGPVNFTTLESCPSPTQLEKVSQTDNSVTISWNGHNAQAWVIEYKQSAATTYTSKNVTSSTNQTISDLAASSTYNIRVKAKCENNQDSQYSEEISFSTPCNTISTFPYFEGFESESSSLDCWTIIDVNGDAEEFYVKGKWYFSEDQVKCVFNETNPANDWLISPRLHLEENMTLCFKYRTSQAHFNEKFSVWLIKGDSPDDYNASSTIEIRPTATVNNTSYIKIPEISLADYSGEKVYIGIKCESDAGMSTLWIDDFEVKKTHIEKNILSFTLAQQTSPAEILPADSKVNIEVKHSTDITNLSPIITISANTTISPESESPQNFEQPVTYKVSAADGSSQDWIVTVSIADPPSNENEILNFSFTNQIGISQIDTENKSVTALAKWDQDLSAISPSIEVSPFASISPNSGVVQDFTSSKTYTVTAQDGTSKSDWTISITKVENSCTAGFSIPFSEDFKNNNISKDCWTIIDNNNDGNAEGHGKWSIETDSDNDSYAEYLYSQTKDADDWLVSPKITITNNANLNFEFRGNSFSGEKEKFSIWLITGSPDNIENPINLLETQTIDNMSWKKIEDISLRDYFGQEVYIAIKCESKKNMLHLHIRNFKLEAVPNKFKIVSSAGSNGKIDPVGEHFYEDLATQQYSILPDNGYEINIVKVDNIDITQDLTDNKYTFENIHADHIITATFKPINAVSHTVTTDVNGGNGTISPASITALSGENVEITITPDSKYIVDEILDNGQKKTENLNGNKYIINNISGNHHVVVKFKLANNIMEESNIKVNIFPNPTNNILNIEVSNEISYIEILTLNAKLLYKIDVNNNTYQYHTTDLANGNYIIKIHSQDKTIIKQFTVNR